MPPEKQNGLLGISGHSYSFCEDGKIGRSLNFQNTANFDREFKLVVKQIRIAQIMTENSISYKK